MQLAKCLAEVVGDGMGAYVHAVGDLVVVQSLGDGPGGGCGPVAAGDAVLAQPPPDAGLVAVGAGLSVSVEGGFEVSDGLVLGRVREQHGEVFGGGGSGPQVGMLCRGVGEKAHVTGGQAPAVSNSSGQD